MLCNFLFVVVDNVAGCLKGRVNSFAVERNSKGLLTCTGSCPDRWIHMEFLVGTLGFSCMLIALAALVGEIVLSVPSLINILCIL